MAFGLTSLYILLTFLSLTDTFPSLVDYRIQFILLIACGAIAAQVSKILSIGFLLRENLTVPGKPPGMVFCFSFFCPPWQQFPPNPNFWD